MIAIDRRAAGDIDSGGASGARVVAPHRVQEQLAAIGRGAGTRTKSTKKWPAGEEMVGADRTIPTRSHGVVVVSVGYIEERADHDAINYKVAVHRSGEPAAHDEDHSGLSLPEHVGRRRASDAGRSSRSTWAAFRAKGLACIDYLGISGPDKDAKHPITKEVYGRQRGVLIGTKGLPLEDELIEPPPITSAKITDGLSHTIASPSARAAA